MGAKAAKLTKLTKPREAGSVGGPNPGAIPPDIPDMESNGLQWFIMICNDYKINVVIMVINHY